MAAPLGRVTGVLGCGYAGVRKGRFRKVCHRHHTRTAEAAGAAGLDQLTKTLLGRGMIMRD